MTAPTPILPAAGPAPYASLSAASRGRMTAEPESPTRSCWQRDRDRIVHSGAFRKLKYKTQVFVYHEGDYYRTRLTHSLEVSQIARSICRTLGLNEDLAEAVALAHDLGHTPFGHAGERALNACMGPYDGFSHNDQSLRILTRLERRYAEFDGLNLTWETLEGVVKHNGPLTLSASDDGKALPVTIRDHQAAGRFDLEIDTWPGLEAQVAALADDIAYNNHDIDDGVRAGFFTMDDAAELPVVGPIVAGLRARYPGLEQGRLIHETVRRMINVMVADVVAETAARLDAVRPTCVADVRRAGGALVAFSPDMDAAQKTIRAFLRARVYSDYRVNREMSKCKRIVTALFELFMAEPETLPTPWQQELAAAPGDPMQARARLVADYIAGMTDRFALLEHRRLFDLTTRS
jgi:dGTPase